MVNEGRVRLGLFPPASAPARRRGNNGNVEGERDTRKRDDLVADPFFQKGHQPGLSP